MISSFFLFLSILNPNLEFNSGSFLAVKDCNYFTVDQFENIYVAIDEELHKYNASFKKTASYSNPLFSEISMIDASNAMNPLLFFGETYRIAILDNRLNESLNLGLIDLGFTDPKLVSVSDERHLWVYDQSSDKLIRYQIETNRQTNLSLNISQILGVENTPIQMISTFDQVFLNIPEKGIAMFDATGSFQKIYPIKGITEFQIEGGSLYFLKDNQIEAINISNSLQSIIKHDIEKTTSFKIVGHKLYLLQANGIQILEL